MLNPAAPNTSEQLADFCNGQGITGHQTAAEAHWQLGKVERHGQWFQRILLKVLDEVRPTTQEEHETCLTQVASAKNSLMMEVGASPYQLVFGRNPRVPSDVLQEHANPAASDACEQDSLMQRANSVRQAARRAMVEVQDDRALRAALRARPRVA